MFKMRLPRERFLCWLQLASFYLGTDGHFDKAHNTSKQERSTGNQEPMARSSCCMVEAPWRNSNHARKPRGWAPTYPKSGLRGPHWDIMEVTIFDKKSTPFMLG